MVLVVCRAEGKHLAGLWEFPGGKVHMGEAPKDCIVREIKEELSLVVSPITALEQVEHTYEGKDGPEKTIQLIPFICSILDGTLELREHTEARWLWPEDLKTLKLCPADVPVALAYIEHTRYDV